MNLDEYLLQLVEPNRAEGPAFASVPTVPVLEQARADRLRIAALAEQVKRAAAENVAEMQRLKERAEELNREIGGPNNADQR